jgi:Xaa-Pro aminopeptidase
MIKNLISQRITKLQNFLSIHQLILLSKSSDIFYFSSFINSIPEERSAFCLISKNSAYLLVQSFLPKLAKFPGEILVGTSPLKLMGHLKNLQSDLNLNEILLDLENLNVEEFKAIGKVKNYTINALDKKIIWRLRTIKDQSEIKKIKIAKKITHQAILATIKELKIGLTELEVKKNLENKIRQHAFCELAFPSIIAFDQNSTLPHHQSNHKKLKNGSIILIDAGAKYQEYCADTTRTIFFKQVGENCTSKKNQQKEKEFKKILQVVKNAYKETKKLISSTNINATDLDAACRNYIRKKGYDKNFIHTTGHGVGIEVHEPPLIYQTNWTKLIPGMVFTIEPGIYLKGKFGVRWENTVFYQSLPSGD